ncbi:hypothetical protein [Mesorhizobium sp. M0678]|uniref:hypothetical protein n=1 Tax=unclassified Mesorhizobium TaxID=325217 RepID=UPI0033392FA9
MPTSPDPTEVSLKVRLPKELMDSINEYRHAHKHDSKKDAVIALLRAGLGGAGANASNE